MILKTGGKVLGIRSHGINVHLGLDRQNQPKKNGHWLHI